MKITDIRIGERARRDLGNVESLAESIKHVGLLHPVVLTTNGELVSGYRRIEAFKRLGREEIPHRIADNLHDALLALEAERDENVERKDLTPLEAVEMAKRLEATEREAAEKRAEEGRRRGGHARHDSSFRKTFPEADQRAADQIASAVGYSRPTLEKIRAVAEAAQGDPAQFGKLAEVMNTTGKVDPAHKKLQKMMAGDSSENAPEDGTIHSWKMGLKKIQNFIHRKMEEGGPASILDKVSAEGRRRAASELRGIAGVFQVWARVLDGQGSETVSLPGDSHAAIEPDRTSPGDQTVAPGNQQDGTAPIEASEDVGQADPPAYPEEISNYFQGLKRKRNGRKGTKQKPARRQRIRDVSH